MIAIEEISEHQQTSKEAFNTIIKALKDPYYGLRVLALEKIDLFQKYNKKEAIFKIENLAKNDNSTLVKAAALNVLGKLVDPIYKPLFERGMLSESYAMVGSSLISLYQIDKSGALNKMNNLDNDIK